MASKTKIVGIALVVVAVSAILVYIPLSSASSQNKRRNEDFNPITIQINEELPVIPQFGKCRPMLLGLLRRFIANATPAEIHGTVVALVRRMLVLSTTGGQVRIHLPPTWIVGEEVLEVEDLFETGYLTRGQDVTVKTLKRTVFTSEAYSIYVLFGYEIINENGEHAYAVLPFNIEIH